MQKLSFVQLNMAAGHMSAYTLYFGIGILIYLELSNGVCLSVLKLALAEYASNAALNSKYE